MEELNCKKLAELFSLFSAPSRLKILCVLRTGELTVSELVTSTGYSKHNLSAQLKLLRLHGVIEQRREGKSVLTKIKNKKLVKFLAKTADSLQDFEFSEVRL